ncbi:hypothetical protein AB2L28_04470 [Kineococcus sp. TBRC 1896]|uniref:Uncharacterized protein n=1 Tax=Kineococcus mangrovi TaxID=1660183 RepID=A0ABV4I0C1_9ACTN
MEALPSRRPRTTAFPLALLLGLVAAASLGAMAAWAGEPPLRSVRFAVFAGAAAFPCVSLGWVLVRSRQLGPADPRAEDSVEKVWFERACAGAFLDLATGCGLFLTLLSVTDTEVGGTGVLCAVLLAGLADAAVRFCVQRRAGS